jgi:hypothetical protein
MAKMFLKQFCYSLRIRLILGQIKIKVEEFQLLITITKNVINAFIFRLSIIKSDEDEQREG